MSSHLILHLIATGLAVIGASSFLREALTHPSFTRPSYRLSGVAAIMVILLLILCAIWL